MLPRTIVQKCIIHNEQKAEFYLGTILIRIKVQMANNSYPTARRHVVMTQAIDLQ